MGHQKLCEGCQGNDQQSFGNAGSTYLRLTKWAANAPAVLEDVDKSKQLEAHIDLQKEKRDIEILGLQVTSGRLRWLKH